MLPADRVPAARVVVVSSESHRSAEPLDPTSLTAAREYGARQSVAEYGRTKLMVTTFAQALARRLHDADQPRWSQDPPDNDADGSGCHISQFEGSIARPPLDEFEANPKA